jgi:hypothetical protein
MLLPRKTLTKSRELSSSKKILKNSPYSRSIYEAEESPPHYQQIPITPERVPIDRGEYGATRPKERLANNLNYKIDSIIKHNSYLLDENNKLTEIIRNKDEQIHILESRLEQQLGEEESNLIMIEQEKNRILIEVRNELEIKDRQINTLLSQIQVITEELDIRDNQYKTSILKLKEEMSRESQNKVENLKLSQIYNIEIYETQINKLKETLIFKQEQLEQQEHHYVVKEKRLEEEVRILNSEYKHLDERKGIEIEELKIKY